MKRQPSGWLFFSLLVISLLAACSSTAPLPQATDSRVIPAGSSFGQTFTSLNNGLSGISVLLGPSSGSGSLLFHLRTNQQSLEDLARARLPLSKINHDGYYKFDFPAQRNSLRADYFLQVDVEGEGQVRIYTALADSYLDGALYENQAAQDAQLEFLLGYDRLQYLAGVAELVIKWVGVLLVGIFAFILPGWVIFSLLWPGWDELNWGAKLGLAAGISLAIYPLFLLWTNLAGLHLGAVYAWLPPMIGLVALGWKYHRAIFQARSGAEIRISLVGFIKRQFNLINLADLAAIVIIGLVIISRLWVIRSLDVPLYGDSYQHTVITQLIIDHNGLFNSWEPYAALSSFTYHFGFHSLAAVFHWISGASSARSVLWTGQLVNILAVLALYPLAYKITRNKWAGVIAILVGGLITSTPMTYVNWGRYTQLAGQAILPAVIWTVWTLLEKPATTGGNISLFRKLVFWKNLSIDTGSLVITWLAFAGLALTHYRILILAVLFFPALLVFSLKRGTISTRLGRIAWIGLGGFALFIPWFIHVYGGTLSNVFSQQITTLPPQIANRYEIIYSLKNLQSYLPKTIWVLLILAIIWGLVRRKKDLAIFTVWWLIVLVAANPQWIGLPGTDVITNFALFIAFYIPAAVIMGTVIEWIPPFKGLVASLESPVGHTPFPAVVLPVILIIATVAIGLWGLPQRLNDLDVTKYALITRPDLRAMAWIQQGTPAEATFLVNSFFAYNNTLVAGSDGGWWLPILATRKTSLPPITYGFEEGSGTSNLTEINEINQQIQTKGVADAGVLARLEDHGISYIYIGQRQGSVNYGGPDKLDPLVISRNPNFETIYHQDRVWIFKIVP